MAGTKYQVKNKRYLNPLIPNVSSHLYQLDESISNSGLLGGICHFNSNFNNNFCKQTVENLIRRFALFVDVPQKGR